MRRFGLEKLPKGEGEDEAAVLKQFRRPQRKLDDDSDDYDDKVR